MKRFGIYAAMAVNFGVIIAIFVSFHVWVMDAPRTTLLWSNGAFGAYSMGYMLAIVCAGMCALPMVMMNDELKEMK